MAHEDSLLLCILIPTYKRNEKLAHLLHAYQEVLADNPDIEIIVSNNDPSCNDSEKIVADLGFPQIKYVRQRVNIGPIIHLGWLLGQSEGKYTWLHSDDDIMTAAELRLVVNQIRENPGVAYFFIPAISENQSNGDSTKAKIDEFYWKNGGDLYVENYPITTLITTGIYKTQAIQSELGGQINFSSYFFFPISVTAASVGAGYHIQGVMISQGLNFSIKEKSKQRKIFLRHMYEELLSYKGWSYWQRNTALVNDLFRYAPHGTVLAALLLFETSMFFRLLVRHPLAIIPALPVHMLASVRRLITGVL